MVGRMSKVRDFGTTLKLLILSFLEIIEPVRSENWAVNPMILNISYKISRMYMFKLGWKFCKNSTFYSSAIFLTDACPNPRPCMQSFMKCAASNKLPNILNFEKRQKQKLKV